MLLQMLDTLQTTVQSPQRITNRAVESAYAIWVKRYPEWEAAFFDEHFLHTHVMPRFSSGEFPTAATLAKAWVIQMGVGSEQADELIAELTPVATDLLYVVKSERCYVEETSAQKWQIARWLVCLFSGKSQARRAGSFS